jgi:trimethylamine---corrinoid protein Co-methyltransferase
MKISLLTPEQIEKVHTTSLRILEHVGVEVPHDETLRRFADCGARVDPETNRVRIPPELVTRLVETSGKRFSIYGWDTSNRASFGMGTRNYNSIAGEASWVEFPGGDRRYTVLSDVAEAARVCDALPNINIVGAMADPSDIPVPYRCVEVAATALMNTDKPVTFWFHDRASAHFLVEMAIALRGSEREAREYPPFYPFLEPISPLHFPFHGIDLLYETARLNLPVPIGPMAQTGISAPGTLAATMAQENAEILAGICITQLIREGMPVCYGGICHAFDMKTTQLIFGGPEQALFGVGMTEMGKFYGLPVYINVGLTDSKRPDAQAGLEAGITLMLGAAAGADIFGHMGICGVDQATSLDMLVLQNEIIGYVESSLRSIDLSDEAFGFDEISEVGPRGTYIDRTFTAEHFRNEIWFPGLLNRDFYDAWKNSGALSTENVARRELEKLRREHTARNMPDTMRGDIEKVVEAARRHLG